MALTTFYSPRYRAVDANGDPLSLAVLEFFEAGTATPLPVYADVDGNVSLGVTVTANSGGLFAELFMLPQAYDINLYDEDGVLVWSAVDYFPPAAAQAANQDFTAIAGVALAAGELSYISDGSGGLNAGQAYKSDADLEYASATPEMGFVVSAVSLGDTVTLRAGGLVSGLSGLTPGARYYASGTAGAISATAGVFERMVGQALTTTVLVAQTNPPVIAPMDTRLKSICQGRLTLTTGVPVTSADVTAAATLYWALYSGNQIGLYTGTRWVSYEFAQLSVAAPAVANQMYDACVDWNDGTPTLALTAWTNDTTRATALTTQNGILVKTGDTQQRYVGSVRTRTASQFNDAYAFRHVWNYYNRVDRPLRVIDATNSWTAGSDGVIRQANASTANQIDLVVGVAEETITVLVQHRGSNSAGNVFIWTGIGEDSTTAKATGSLGGNVNPAANVVMELHALHTTIPAIGRHFYAWLEEAATAATTTFYGDNNDSLTQSGILARWRA